MRAAFMAMAAAAALCLTACGDGKSTSDGEPLTAARARNGTIAASLAETGDLRTLSAALADTQLAPVLDRKGDYTLLAPTDAAFTALGKKLDELRSPQERPLMIALLRAHILPGQVTPDSIRAAIARKKGPVRMQTMGGTTVTFTDTGAAIAVGNGATTATMGAAATASNGAILTIDKVLLPKT